MSYYNYCDDDHMVSVDFGDAGYHDVSVCIDIDICLERIVAQEKNEILDLLDVDDITCHIISNYGEYKDDVIREACAPGLVEFVDGVVEKFEEDGDEDELAEIVKTATEALARLREPVK